MTLRDISQIILTAFVAIGGTTGVIRLLKLRPERACIVAEARKLGVDAEVALSTAALGMLEPMQQRIGHLETRLAAADGRAVSLNAQLSTALGRVHELETQITGLRAQVTELERTRNGRN